ncbi:hypothetical protein B7P43_G11334 [Cryptotermes secundus]|uniref:Endonuclease/exonuclease/phosphatase domain-containing protein n=1 Tax=Cryptotermes secundus TaxID=105785 RepID=A0A2J7RQ55_9NEOP|nr:hypothetical protein B7P43_G11334 [Cryptotermes secundus]
MKVLLGDFNAKVGREDIFRPTTGNESLHEISNDNGVRVVNFATSKNLTVKSTMFPHLNIHKFTWTSPDGKIHNQIDHILIDRRRYSMSKQKNAQCSYGEVQSQEIKRRRGYQPSSNLVKDENGDLLADSHNILNRWRNCFSPNHLEVESAIAKLERNKSPGSDQISAELIQANGEILRSGIHKLVNYIWNKEELTDQWKESIIVPVHKKGDKTDCNNYREISLLSIQYKFFQYSSLKF